MNKLTVLWIGLLIGLVLTMSPATAANATVIMTFDDGWASVAQNAFPVLNANGQQGVAFVYINPIIGAGYTDYMKKTQLNTLTGWDISSHTMSHAILPNISSQPEQLKNELLGSRQWLVSNGYGQGSMFLAYPEGKSDPQTISAAQTYGYVAGRSVDIVASPYPQYTLGSADIFTMKVFELDCTTPTSNTCTAEGVIEQINNTINASNTSGNGLLILTFHKVVPTLSSGANSSTEFTTANLQAVSDYIKNSNGTVEVKTFSQYFGTPAPAYTAPPAPTSITSTSGSNWILLNWTSGGGTTAAYSIYIDGILKQTSTTNTSYNITSATYGAKYQAQVYAVGTDTLSLSTTPAQINATISGYMPSTPVNLTFTPTVANCTVGINCTIRLNWSAGTLSGNKTDYFRVTITGSSIPDFNMTNNQTNMSYNFTAKPGTIYPVAIFAVNSSNAITMNGTSIFVNALIPIYTPLAPVWVSDGTGTFWAKYGWKNANSGNIVDYYNITVNGKWTIVPENNSVSVNGSNWIITPSNTSGGSPVPNFINITSVPHGTVNLTICSGNNTNSGSQNPTCLKWNITMDNTPVSIVDGIWAEYDRYIGDLWAIIPVVDNPDNDTFIWSTTAHLNHSNISINSSTGIFEVTPAEGDQGDYNWTITARETMVGGTNQTINFTVHITTKPAPHYSNGGGSSGGGGGAPSMYDPNAETTERHDSTLRYGVITNISFTKNPLVSAVTFEGVKNYGDISVKSTTLKQSPVWQNMTNVYKYFNVQVDMIQQPSEYLYFTNATVVIFINNSDLTDKTLKAYRFYNSEFRPIEVTNINSDDTKTYFKLNASGLSNFAVTLTPKATPISASRYKEMKNVQGTPEPTPQDVSTTLQKTKESLYRFILEMLKKYMFWI